MQIENEEEKITIDNTLNISIIPSRTTPLLHIKE